jgi:hypothetical protein
MTRLRGFRPLVVSVVDSSLPGTRDVPGGAAAGSLRYAACGRS